MNYVHFISQGGYMLQILQGNTIEHWLTTTGEWLGEDDVT